MRPYVTGRLRFRFRNSRDAIVSSGWARANNMDSSPCSGVGKEPGIGPIFERMPLEILPATELTAWNSTPFNQRRGNKKPSLTRRESKSLRLRSVNGFSEKTACAITDPQRRIRRQCAVAVAKVMVAVLIPRVPQE